jgi:simple sugar transport system ATP-binding protein
MMVGREVNTGGLPMQVEQGEALLTVKDLCTERTRYSGGLDRICFSLHKGEVLGVAGVDGNGQSELVEALLGLCKATGSVRKNGTEMNGLSSAAIRESVLAGTDH